MPKVSINILTKNRAGLLQKALDSVFNQSFSDFEVIVVNDGSGDGTLSMLKNFNVKIINHPSSQGITVSRQEALLASGGEYVAILDDDDVWGEKDKLKKQVEFLENHQDYVLVGGGIKASDELRLRSENDQQIRNSMLIRNNFFTSTVMFRKSAAIKAGGFIKDQDDFAEDYDLWLRMGKIGKMYNFQQAFADYRVPNYNKERFKAFLRKQLRLIHREKSNYPNFWPAKIALLLRIYL